MRSAIVGIMVAGLSVTACGAAPPSAPLAPAVASAPSTASVPAAVPAARSAPAAAMPALLSELPPPIPPNTMVLHIGDSFTISGFSQALRPRMTSLRARYAVKSEQSSFTVTWAPKIERLILRHQPDLVIINLGANEVANIDPPAHASAVRRIVKSIGDRPCVWVSPPLWRKDTGIIDVIRENSAPCRFFDSDALVPGPIPRQRDQIHPSKQGGAIWAEAFWRWLEAQRASPTDPTRGGGTLSPWALKPAPPEEHRPRRDAAALK